MFFESSVKEKCEIIRTLRLMLLNLVSNWSFFSKFLFKLRGGTGF